MFSLEQALPEIFLAAVGIGVAVGALFWLGGFR